MSMDSKEYAKDLIDTSNLPLFDKDYYKYSIDNPNLTEGEFCSLFVQLLSLNIQRGGLHGNATTG